jgi:16S rRNA (cytidine1402-2'-O)-methyltransferase
VITEAGCPGVADPGAAIAALAHERDIPVVPLVGPSSILLALMASGMNGQRFVFHGYLPIDKNDKIKALLEIEKAAVRSDQTQIFMETPYRNNHILRDILQTCNGATRLCVAADLTLPTEFIKTKTMTAWKKEALPDLDKRPAIFLIYNK